MEALDQVSRRDKGGHRSLDRGDHHRLGPGQLVAAGQHRSRDGPGRRHPARRAAIGLLAAPAPRAPFSDGPQGAAEALAAQQPPDLGGVVALGSPHGLQPRQPGRQTARAAANTSSSRWRRPALTSFLLRPVRRTISLMGVPAAAMARIASFASRRRR